MRGQLYLPDFSTCGFIDNFIHNGRFADYIFWKLLDYGMFEKVVATEPVKVRYVNYKYLVSSTVPLLWQSMRILRRVRVIHQPIPQCQQSPVPKMIVSVSKYKVQWYLSSLNKPSFPHVIGQRWLRISL